MIIELKKQNIYIAVGVFVAFLIFLFIILFFGMSKDSTNQTLVMGRAEMYVQDLEKVKEFYVDLVGLDIIKEEDGYVELGQNGINSISLIQKDGFTFENSSEAGLYHNAFVFNSRSALAESINTILTKAPQYYEGSADHLVSEAFYFADPEGNGVELYFDKPREVWEYDENGKPVMGGIYINEREYIEQNINQSGSDGSKMGHIHLKVGSIQQAHDFYVDILGFDIIMNRSNALFVSRDGYHHHIGINTWESLGAGVRKEDVYGLYSFELQITDKNTFEEIKNNIEKSEFNIKEISTKEIETRDPWGNVVKIKLQ